jgi:hypothetical protein
LQPLQFIVAGKFEGDEIPEVLYSEYSLLASEIMANPLPGEKESPPAPDTITPTTNPPERKKALEDVFTLQFELQSLPDHDPALWLSFVVTPETSNMIP